MCGIAGYKINQAINPNVLDKMLGSLVHRGPDSKSQFNSGFYHAGIQRLAINDLSGGDQPLYSEDKQVVLIYNGEIYNSPKLRSDLIKKGYNFRTNSDGEVICHLYKEVQEKLFGMLDGMFSIALWIESEQKLILARDVAGEKPLYYTKISETEILFASEIKSMTSFPYKFSLNHQAIWDFPTFLWIPEPETIFNEINALPPGHILTVDSSGMHLTPYFRPAFDSEVKSEEDLITQTREIVTEAIQSRLLSDVPVGCFLSGGLDSSIVTAVTAKELGGIDTFNVAFEDLKDPYHGYSDESKEAKEFSDYLGTRHHILKVTADSFRQSLEQFTYSGDQPFAVSSGLGILAVAEAASNAGVKVLLSGDGADECFGGYSWYSHLESPLLKNNNTQNHSDRITSFHNSGLDIPQKLSILSQYSSVEKAWAWHYYAHESDKKELFNPDWFNSLKSSQRHFENYKYDSEWEPQDYIRHDRLFYFPNEMLSKVDRMTMAYSVESRVPFAATAVLNHAENLSYKHMVRDGSLKWILRRAFSHILPETILNRTKHGFNVPIDHWLKNEWKDMVEETFSSSSALYKLGVIHKKSRDRAIQMLHDSDHFNGHTILCYIMLNQWLELFYYK